MRSPSVARVVALASRIRVGWRSASARMQGHVEACADNAGAAAWENGVGPEGSGGAPPPKGDGAVGDGEGVDGAVVRGAIGDGVLRDGVLRDEVVMPPLHPI